MDPPVRTETEDRLADAGPDKNAKARSGPCQVKLNEEPSVTIKPSVVRSIVPRASTRSRTQFDLADCHVVLWHANFLAIRFVRLSRQV